MKHLYIHTGDRYLCNQAVSIDKDKATWDKKKVTCKNCLRQIKKRVCYSQQRTYVTLSQRVTDKLDKIKQPCESYESVITRLVTWYKEIYMNVEKRGIRKHGKK